MELQGSVDDVTTQFANTIYSVTIKFIPSCIPKGLQPTYAMLEPFL